MLRRLWIHLTARFQPIAPFVLDVIDQLDLDPENFLAIQAEGSDLLTLRPMSGPQATHGVSLVYNGYADTVAFRTFVFPEGVPLNRREHNALREAVTSWLEDLDDTHERFELDISYGGSV